MFRLAFLRNLFILSLVATSCLPLYTLYVLHPSYHEQLIHETEQESARFASYLIRVLGMEGVSLGKETLPAKTLKEVQKLQSDEHLLKLRFFSPAGEIIYSTQPEEVGRVNEKDYFHQAVARGQIYSKVVRKNARTADGQKIGIDVVETYVPFMADKRFGGAIEVYYDITGRVDKINRLTLRTTLTLIAVATVLMLAISLALRNAGSAISEQVRAEQALREANEDLERRVAERTRELQQSNEQLTSEIAERTLAQMALSQALEDSRVDREKLNGILRSVPDGLLVTDRAFNIVHMNAAAESLLDVPLEKALGQPVDSLPLAEQFLPKLTLTSSDQHNGQTFDFEIPTRDPKNPKIFQARLSSLNTEGQNSPGVIMLIHDVTMEREIEKMKSAFLGMAAHELNTPLTSIIGYSELLTSPETAKKFDSGQTRDCLDLIHQKALSLSRLVDDLLDISRIESGQPLALNFRTCHLQGLLHDVLKTYQQECPRHSFELLVPDQTLTLAADCERIQQVLLNLISNAVKYSPHGGKIRVAVSAQGETCQLLVEDEGIGMTPEQLEHVFDRFYRADSSNTAVPGAGLGMSIARHIIEAHGGTVRVESRRGEGTRVVVHLPLAQRKEASAMA